MPHSAANGQRSSRLRCWQKLGLWLAIVVSFVLLSGLLSLAPWCNPAKDPLTGSFKPVSSELILKEYDAAVQEIRLRLEQEHVLFTLKFTFFGALLGSAALVLGKKDGGLFSPGVAVAWWGAVAVAAILDLRLQLNTQIIVDHGQWVRTLEQGDLLPPLGTKGWEDFYASSPVRTDQHKLLSLLLNLDRPLLKWLLFVVTLYACIISRQEDHHPELLAVSKYAMPVCFLLFGLSSLSHYSMRITSLSAVLVITILSAVGAFFWVRSYESSARVRA
jgi:hypothetical protein